MSRKKSWREIWGNQFSRQRRRLVFGAGIFFFLFFVWLGGRCLCVCVWVGVDLKALGFSEGKGRRDVRCEMLGHKGWRVQKEDM